MTDQIQEILTKYGQMVTIRLADGDAATRAFLQPVAEKREVFPETITALGALDRRLWIYLGRTAVEPNDRILWNNTEFRVRSSRPYYMGDMLLYWWAALEQAKEAAQ